MEAKCSYCGAIQQFPEEYIGREISCLNCKKRFKITEENSYYGIETLRNNITEFILHSRLYGLLFLLSLFLCVFYGYKVFSSEEKFYVILYVFPFLFFLCLLYSLLNVPYSYDIIVPFVLSSDFFYEKGDIFLWYKMRFTNLSKKNKIISCLLLKDQHNNEYKRVLFPTLENKLGCPELKSDESINPGTSTLRYIVFLVPSYKLKYEIVC